jgi:hypothetical protein
LVGVPGAGRAPRPDPPSSSAAGALLFFSAEISGRTASISTISKPTSAIV